MSALFLAAVFNVIRRGSDFVPEGHVTIAQRFIAGEERRKRAIPSRRDA
jgi:hypothetical protein